MSKDPSEFQTLVKGELDRLEKENTKEDFFKKLVLTHTLHSSTRSEELKSKLGSLESKQENLDKDLRVLTEGFLSFKNDQIKTLEERVSKMEKNLLVGTGICLSVFSIPYIPTVVNFFIRTTHETPHIVTHDK